jgi:hypothetical protein
LPAFLYGKTSTWTSSVAFHGVPVEFLGVLWFAFAAVAVRDETRVKYPTIDSVLFWSACGAVGAGVGLQTRASWSCWPIWLATGSAGIVLIAALRRFRVPMRSEAILAAPGQIAGDLRTLSSKPSNVFISALGLIVAAGVVQYLVFRANATTDADRENQLARWYFAQPRLASEDLVEAGKIKVVVFSDYECPACSVMVPQFDRLVARYHDGGYPQVEIVHRDFPLDPACNPSISIKLHPAACKASTLVRFLERTAGPARAEATRSAFYSRHGAVALEDVDKLLAASGLSDRFQLENAQDAARVALDVASGGRLGISGTPTVFVDGRLIRSLTPDGLGTILGYLVRDAAPRSVGMQPRTGD